MTDEKKWTASLDIVIPTYNRPDLLALTLDSINSACCPENLDLTVFIVDNNSTQPNSSSYKELSSRFEKLRVVYLHETNQGRSWALNKGISLTTASYVGFIDDDETIDKSWLTVATKHIIEDKLDYIGGPCMPNWESPPPQWLPVHTGMYKGVLGWIEQSSKLQSFDDFNGTLVGGNALVRRSALLALGGYSTELGRSGSNLMGGEDEEFHRRLRSIGAVGKYDPQLIIFHLIPTRRMSKSYHLRWSFWSGASNGKRLNWETRESVPHLFGFPRYRYKKAASGIIKFITSLAKSQKEEKSSGFSGLMDAFYFAGMIYGKHRL